MTGPEARQLLAQLRLPRGFHLEHVVVRHHRFRDKIAIVAFKDSMPVKSWPPVYDVEGFLPIALEWVQEQARPVVVTTDADGWVESIERGAA